THLLHGRQQQADEHGDDRDHHQQLNEGKTLTTTHGPDSSRTGKQGKIVPAPTTRPNKENALGFVLTDRGDLRGSRSSRFRHVAMESPVVGEFLTMTSANPY